MAPAARRRWAYVAVGIAVLVGARLFGRSSAPTPEPPAETASTTARDAPSGPPPAEPPTSALRRPPSAIVEFGVLTASAPPAIEAVLDRQALGRRLGAAWCGDAEACEASAAMVRDEHTTELRVAAASDWNVGLDPEAGTDTLTAAERARLPKLERLVIVRVAAPTGARQLAVRTAFAAAGVIAEAVDGLVDDQVLARIEGPRAFRLHAVTEALDASSFRKDRIELVFEREGPGLVRVLTAGLSRWGAPDVDATPVATASQARVAEIVLGLAQAIADGAAVDRIVLSRDDLGRARGRAYDEPDLPPLTPVPITLRSENPRTGDPNDFIAHVVPGPSDGALGYLELAERFFGADRAAAPEPGVLAKQRARAQADLPSALAGWAPGRGKLLVRFPFAIPGDEAAESMWIAVTRFDATSITGTVQDEPLAAGDVARGDEVTRKRSEVEDIEFVPSTSGTTK
ncbi:MAG TPA: DUF2314 domain-containing protein [Polyangiaceae bacterium]|nr:DUF2314 domain-containing protein [Polyangiaceae bacterium]